MIPQAVDDLRVINAQFIDNFVTNDVAAHDALLHPSFLYVRGDGSRVDRATYLDGWATGFDPEVIVYWDVRDELITVVGDVALVRSTNKETIRQDGREVTSMSTYTDTYVVEDGHWLCAQAQITPVARDNEPADDTIVAVWVSAAPAHEQVDSMETYYMESDCYRRYAWRRAACVGSTIWCVWRSCCGIGSMLGCASATGSRWRSSRRCTRCRPGAEACASAIWRPRCA